jgi:hypothetical protein
MKNNIQKLIQIFSTPGNRCKGSYERGGRYCLLGAMSNLLTVEDNYELKKYLEGKLGEFVLQFNSYNVNKINIDKENTGKVNLNLATFNDNVEDKTLIEFLTFCKKTLP